MHPRLVIISLIALLQIVVLLGSAVSAADAPDYEAYAVKGGETLASIAAYYAVPTDYLARFNGLNPGDALAPGQVLRVPAVAQSAPEGELSATAATPAGDQVSGVLGRVSAAQTEIRSKPGGGQVLFRRAGEGLSLLVIGQSATHYAVLMSDGGTGWVPRSAVTLSSTPMVVPRPAPPAPAAGRQEIVDTAFEYLGVPYVYGGRLPDSVDCSLLVQTVFARHGIRLPRTAAQQSAVGAPVDAQELQPGDRLYFYTRPGVIGHAGIYVGNGRFIHASSNRGAVAVDDLSDGVYWRKFAGARR